MNKLLVANWKLYPSTITEALKLARASDHKNVVVCPPFSFLSSVKKVLKHAALGAQDVFWEELGPHTGEVSAAMLKSVGVQYVIVGHSERRKMGETDEMVSAKVAAALIAGLKVILCVGEPLSVRRKGVAHAVRFVEKQLTKNLASTTHYSLLSTRLLIAYEPIWAVGTGKPDKPEETAHIVARIKHLLSTRYSLLTPRVLYGGSVNAKNAKRFLRVTDGALVGGVSLKHRDFREVVRVAADMR